MERDIRSVRLELLREGPPHNQLLSPLTRYLARCGDAAAQGVTVPFEHRDFIHRLRQLRYQGGAAEEDSARRYLLDQTGREMADILGRVPGFVATLNHLRSAVDPLVHLQLELTPSELALLPFELANMPPDAPGATSDFLCLQSTVPVTVTRRVHGVSGDRVRWPRHPRVLFAWSDSEDAVDHERHRGALHQALAPWRHPVKGFDEILTELPEVTLDALQRALEGQTYGYVHLLAHGGESGDEAGRSYGLMLYNAGGRRDWISGGRLAGAICPPTRSPTEWPAVVTVAACDSGNVGSIHDRTGASLAHSLHQAGVPMVVASQFPLSIAGAPLVTAELYQGFASAEDPRVRLHALRNRLSGQNDRYHDWASLVVYAALPGDLASQLEEVRYRHARLADDLAFGAVNHALETAPEDADVWETVTRRVADALAGYPTRGEFLAESEGMRGSGYKRLAQARFQLAQARPADSPEDRDALLDASLRDLDTAARHYWRAGEIFLAPGTGRVQRMASLHWVLTQWLSLRVVLGLELDADLWTTAKVSAEMELRRCGAAERVWPLGSLAELYLLQLAMPEPQRSAGADAGKRALHCVRELVDLDREPDSFPVFSTRRGIARYLEWWGSAEFVAALDRNRGRRLVDWSGSGGVMDTAREMVEALRTFPS